MAPYISKAHTASHFHRSVRTIENWLGQGFISGYRDGQDQLLFDVEEIERALKFNPHMRDGRRPYGSKARIVPLPVEVQAVAEAGEGL